MNFKTFILILLSSYLSIVSGQFEYIQLYSYYGYLNGYLNGYPNGYLNGYPNDYQYPSYSVPYYSSYVIPTYYSHYVGLPNSTNTTLINSTTNAPTIQRSSSTINNIIDIFYIYIIVFIGIVIDVIMNIM